MPKDGKDKSKDKSTSKPVASQDGDSDIEEEQIKVRCKTIRKMIGVKLLYIAP